MLPKSSSKHHNYRYDIYQLSSGNSRLKCIRIMTCLCPLNTTECSQVCNYWWAVSRLWLMRTTTINSGSLYISQLIIWGPPSLLHKMYGGGVLSSRAKRVWREVDLSLSPLSNFKNEWSCNSSPSIRLFHVNRENLTFFKFLNMFSAVGTFWFKFDSRISFYFGNSKIIVRH